MKKTNSAVKFVGALAALLGLGVLGGGTLMGVVAFSAWFFRFSWNAFMPVVFGAAELTFLQALGGLSLLAGLVLFLRLLRGGN